MDVTMTTTALMTLATLTGGAATPTQLGMMANGSAALLRVPTYALRHLIYVMFLINE